MTLHPVTQDCGAQAVGTHRFLIMSAALGVHGYPLGGPTNTLKLYPNYKHICIILFWKDTFYFHQILKLGH